MLHLFILIMLFQAGALILPGPDFAIVCRYSIIHGKQAGIYAACGVSLGVAILLLITFVLGDTLYRNYYPLYICFVSIGVAFLYYLSFTLIRNFLNWRQLHQSQTTPTIINDVSEIDISPLKSSPFLHGLFTNLSNIKAIVFFGSILPLVNRLNMTFITLTWLGMIASAIVWFILVACIIAQPAIRRLFQTKLYIIELVIGTVIFIFASIIFYVYIVQYLKSLF